MANPQKEDGYTPIANAILDRLVRMNMPNYEWRVVLTLLRKTYGWSKKEDVISLSQFSAATGIKDNHVCRAIKNLVEKNIVTKVGNGYYTKYSLQKDFEAWKPLPVQVPIPIRGLPNQGLPNQGDTKAISTKASVYSVYMDIFNTLWERYPNKDGKKASIRSFNSSVKSEKDCADIQQALNNYLSSQKVLDGYVKNASTWFNNWPDWIVCPIKDVNHDIPESLRQFVKQEKHRR